MTITFIQPTQLLEFGLTADSANMLAQEINHYIDPSSAEKSWQGLSKKILNHKIPFALHLFLFKHIFPHWPRKPESGYAWIPNEDLIKTTHISQFMAKLKIQHYSDFHAWSTKYYEKFWESVIQQLHIVFHERPKKICDISHDIESPSWLYGAKLNITDSCFTASPHKTAILFQDEKGDLKKMSYEELNTLSSRIANSLISRGFKAGDAIAIDMPMTPFAVGIYLGIIKMGGIVVSIADSFSKEEIATRLQISKAKAIFTQDFILRDKKKLPLYEKVMSANAPLAIVLPSQQDITIPLRKDDMDWNTFLIAKEKFNSYMCDPMTHCNILFSSGTTGEPKAIPWNHTTAIKVASDAYFHHNIQDNDILAWPTNLGWMMGPWLIFASLINQATIALYTESPRERSFGQFIQDANVTMLGVVPTLVATWRQSNCMEGLNWDSIKLFSSTGECSNPEDMLFLMSLANYKPIIEYCGGTEIGGAYLTSTMIENNCPSVFTTPTLGLSLCLLDHEGQITNKGEVALIPPSIGLSTELLNANHHEIYYANMPKISPHLTLRRHGDQICRFANNTYCVLGRADDTMNLGGIKISSAEIERVLAGIDHIIETAAIAVTPPNNGPSDLIIYAATQENLDNLSVKQAMQKKINLHLNPLFKIKDLVFIRELPKTASNKIMRRILREEYIKNISINT